MRGKGKRLKIKKVLAMLLAVLMTATCADFTTLAARENENTAAVEEVSDEGDVMADNEVNPPDMAEGADNQKLPLVEAGGGDAEMKAIQSAELLVPPDRMDYMSSPEVFSQKFDFTGMQVKITFADSTEAILYDGEALPDGRGGTCSYSFNWSEPGEYNVEFNYGEGIIVSIPVRIVALQEYIQGLEVLKEGQTAEIHSSSDILYRDYQFTPEDSGTYMFKMDIEDGSYDLHHSITAADGSRMMDTWTESISCELEGGKTYIISMDGRANNKGKSAYVTVQKTKAVKTLRVVKPPYQQDYLQGQDAYGISLSGMEIEVTYEDDTVEVVEWNSPLENGSNLSTTDNVNFEVPGTYEVTIYINQFPDNSVTTIPVTIYSEEDYVKLFPQLKTGEEQEITITEESSKYFMSPAEDGDYILSFKGTEAALDGLWNGDIQFSDLYGEPAYCDKERVGDAIHIIVTLEAGRKYLAGIKGQTESRLSVNIFRAKTVSRLEILTEPSKTEYIALASGTPGYINQDGLSVRIVYEDGGEETLVNSETAEDGRRLQIFEESVDFSQPGEYPVEVSFGGKSAVFSVYVISEEDYLGRFESLPQGQGQVLDLPEGTRDYIFTPEISGEYIFCMSGLGEGYTELTMLYLEGGYIEASEYQDEDSYSVTANLEAGKHYICRFYSAYEQQLSFSASKAKDVESIEIVTEPYKIKYMAAESWYPPRNDGMTVKVHYGDGSEEMLTPDQPAEDYRCLMIYQNNVDMTLPGEYQVTVSFGGKQDLYTIYVLPADDYLDTLDKLKLETEALLHLPAGGKEYSFMASDSGTYCLEIEDPTDQFQMYSDFNVMDIYGTNITEGVSYENGKYKTWVTVEAGEKYIVSFSNSGAADITFSSTKAKKVRSLEVERPPFKTVYAQVDKGEGVYTNYEGMSIKIEYDDGTKESVAAGNSTSEGRTLSITEDVDFSIPGNYAFRINFGGKYVEIPITVLSQEDYVNSLEKLSLGDMQVLDIKAGMQEYAVVPSVSGTYMFKLSDTAGSSFDGSVDVLDMNGNSKLSGQSWGQERFVQADLKAGQKYICQVLSEADCRLKVSSLRLKNVKKLELASQPDKVDYLVNESAMDHPIEIQGMKVIVTYEDDTTEIVRSTTTLRDSRWLSVSSGPDGWYKNPGTYPITVSLGEQETSFDIHVLTKEDYLNKIESLEIDADKILETDEYSREKSFRFTPTEDGTYIMYAESLAEGYTYDGYVIANVSTADGKAIEQQIGTYRNSGLSTTVELKKNETYIFKLNYNFYHNKGLKIRLIKAKEAAQISLLTTPLRTVYMQGIQYGPDTIGTGIQAEIIYKDGSKEVLKWGQMSQEGRNMVLDPSQINWNQPGVYKVQTAFGEASAEFEVTIQSPETYYSGAEQWDTGELKFAQAAGEVNKVKFEVDQSGFYRLKVDTLGNYPATLTISDDTYDMVSYKSRQSLDWEIGSFNMEYIVKLEAGKQYYLLAYNGSDMSGMACALNIEKLPDVQAVTVNTDKADLTMVAGTMTTMNYFELDVEAVYQDGSKEKLSSNEWVVTSSYDSEVPGIYPQTIEAYGKAASFDITVIQPSDCKNVKSINLNRLESMGYTGTTSKSKALYKFIPTESGTYYLNFQAAGQGSLALLTPDGKRVQTLYASENCFNGGSVAAELTGGAVYYLEAATGSALQMEFMITTEDLQIVNLDGNYKSFTGKEYRPELRVTLNGKQLSASEYTLSYAKNADAGVGYAVIQVKGLPAVKSFFVIDSEPLAETDVSNIPAQGYTGTEICPKPIVTVNGSLLKEGTDYKLRYLNNVETGTAQVLVIGMNNYRGIVKKTFEIQSSGSIEYKLDGGTNNAANTDSYGETGLILKDPAKKGYIFTGWFTDKNLSKKITEIPGSPKKDYTLYAGWEKISVGAASVSSIVNSGTTGLKVQFESVKGAEGYEVYYTQNVLGQEKTVTTAQTSVTITGLKAGTTYYVRVRAYKTDSAGGKVYGAYSSYVSHKTEPPVPAAVTNLSAVAAGKNKVKLTWKASAGAEGYLIYAQKNGKYGYCGMTTKGVTFTDTKALDSEFNFYWVFPYVKDSTDKMLTGGCTKYVYAKGVTLAVTNLKALGRKGGVRLTWTASSGAEGYLVYGQKGTGKYGYIGMTTRGTTYTDTRASKTEYNFYWVFPYHKDTSGKMIVGGTPKYVFGKAK